MTESEHVKLGAYHTIELEPGRSFNLHKALWDGLDIDRIRTATDPQASADLAALLITVRWSCVGSQSLVEQQEAFSMQQDMFLSVLGLTCIVVQSHSICLAWAL
jgi:stalled ribosome rescue protein Dom34